ncbi:MAG: hypothetical protein RR643_05045 [Anaerorhabdus sp.]|uniref:phage head-tail connector protein n=1 Tax=Anaerorhabdus sp. TaxID=1872524 RepID=UPI002FCC8A40
MANPLQLPSILESIRGACGLDTSDESFDMELIMHINSALATLNQNGVGLSISVSDTTQLWESFKDPTQTNGNELFEMVKHYVFVKTKLLFDPPPPSNVQYISEAANEDLWRLRETFNLDKKVVIP